MPISAEQLLIIARNHWREDRDYDHRPETPPEYERLCELWEQELKKPDRWRALLQGLRRDLPEFIIGNATATPDACFRCAVYSYTQHPRKSLRFIVVGCVSILAPVYTVYGVEYGQDDAKRAKPMVCFEPLPSEMRHPADVVARKIEEIFGFSALPREIAETPVPLIVHWKEPPDTKLFHALFTSEPESLP